MCEILTGGLLMQSLFDDRYHKSIDRGLDELVLKMFYCIYK